MIFEPKRMHPAGAILNFIKHLKDLIFPALLFVFIGDDGVYRFYAILGFGVIIIALILSSIISWWKFTYRIESGELRIEHGLFVRKKRYIPIERIQTINSSAGIIQQLFGLVKLKVETAGGDLQAEAELTAISKKEADRIRKALALHKQTLSPNKEEVAIEETYSNKIYTMGTRDLIVAASTSSGIGVVLSASFAFLSQFDELIPYDQIVDRFEFLANASITVYAVLAFIAFFIAWIFSIVGMLLKYAFFTVKKSEKELMISRGIFEKHQLTIPNDRIQAIRISENLIRQPLGYATVFIESASGSVGDDGVSSILFPLIKKKRIPEFLSEFTPDFQHIKELRPLPKRALKRSILRYTLPVVIVAALACIFLRPWGFFSLLLIPIGILYGTLKFKDAGWKIHELQLSLSFRFITKTTVLIHKKRMQVLKNSTSFLQKRLALKTVVTSIKSGLVGKHFSLRDIDQKDSEEICNWFSYEKK